MTSLLVAAAAAAWGDGESAAGKHATTAEGRRGAATAAAGADACRAGLAGLTRLSASAGTAAGTAASRTAGRSVHVDERPLVVMVPPLVEADRFVLALAADAHDPADDRAAAGTAGLGPESSGRTDGSRRRAASAAGLAGLTAPAASRRGLLAGLAGDAALADQLEVVAGDRILVFLADETARHEEVDAPGSRLGFHLVQPQRPHVLLTAEDELFFLFPLGFMAPDGQGGRHQHRHDRHRDEQRRHGISARSVEALTP
jgi:hypothetical protein